MFRQKNRNYNDWDWRDNVDKDKKKLITKMSIGLLIFILLGVLLVNFIIKEPQPYDVEIGEDLVKISENREESIETLEEKNDEIPEGKIKDIELHIEAYKPKTIRIKPMLDGRSGDLYIDLKSLPVENTYDEDINIKLKEENIGTYDKEILMEKVKNEEYEKLNPKVVIASGEDIERLRGYECYKLTGDGKLSKAYVSFEHMYNNHKDTCQWVHTKFHPSMIRYYKNALVTWYTSDKLIYETPVNQMAVRGILRLKYYREDNIYSLKTFKDYERDVEYRLKFTTDGNFVNKIIYLSDWKEVK